MASEVQVVTSSLRGVAQIWDREATAIGSITPEVTAMSFARLEAGVFQLIVAPYDAVVQTVARRCAAGKTEMQSIASALNTNATNYASNEQNLTNDANAANPGH